MPLEYRMIHREGRVVWVRDDAVLAHSEDGELRWHGMLSDITARKQVEAELERRAAQQAAVALLGEHALGGCVHHRSDERGREQRGPDARSPDRGGLGVASR